MAPFTDASRRRGLVESEPASDSQALVFSRQEENFGLDPSISEFVSLDPAVKDNAAKASQIDFAESSGVSQSSTRLSSTVSSNPTSSSASQPIPSKTSSSSKASKTSSANVSKSSSVAKTSSATRSASATVITSVRTTVVPVTSVDSSSHTIVRSSSIATTQLVTVTPGPQRLTASDSNSGNASGKQTNTGAVAAGGVIAALVILGIIAALIFCHLRRKRKRREFEATRVVSPFDQMDGPRDIEHAPISHNIPRVPPPMMQDPRSLDRPPVSAHTAQLVVPSIAVAAQDPFNDKFRIIDAEFESLDLSPGPHSATDAQHLTIAHRSGEQMQVRTASAAAFNPFANPTSPFVNEPRSSPATGPLRGSEHVRQASIKSVSTVSIEEPHHLHVAQQSAVINYTQ